MPHALTALDAKSTHQEALPTAFQRITAPRRIPQDAAFAVNEIRAHDETELLRASLASHSTREHR